MDYYLLKDYKLVIGLIQQFSLSHEKSLKEYSVVHFQQRIGSKIDRLEWEWDWKTKQDRTLKRIRRK